MVAKSSKQLTEPRCYDSERSAAVKLLEQTGKVSTDDEGQWLYRSKILIFFFFHADFFNEEKFFARTVEIPNQVFRGKSLPSEIWLISHMSRKQKARGDFGQLPGIATIGRFFRLIDREHLNTEPRARDQSAPSRSVVFSTRWWTRLH